MRPTLPLLALLALTLSACGGGGSSPSTGGSNPPGGGGSNPARTAVRFRLGWGERSSRAIVGPGSALSARILLNDRATGGAVLLQREDRRDDPAAYEADYATDGKVAPGAYALTATFYAGTGGAGAVVAQGAATVVVANDGSGVGTVATAGTVATVAVDPQRAVLGAPASLAFTARNAQGAVLALSPGSAAWTQVGGADSATVAPDGTVTTKALGTATVRATVDGRTSEPATLTVPPASVAVREGQTVPYGGSLALALDAFDAQGREAEVPAGLASWALTGGAGFLTLDADGTARATHHGTGAQAAATVLGVASPARSLTVERAPLGALAVTAGQKVVVGKTQSLAFTATDRDGKAMDPAALAPTWRIVSGDDVLSLVDPKGVVKGLRAGDASLQASSGGVTSLPATVVVEEPSLIVNPGFETDGAWTYQFASRRTNEGHTGTGCASLAPRYGGPADGPGPPQGYPASLKQTMDGLVAGRTYRVAFWAKRSFSGSSETLSVALGGSSFSIPIPTMAQEWVRYTGALTPSVAGGDLTLTSSVTSRMGQSIVFVDDVEVRFEP